MQGRFVSYLDLMCCGFGGAMLLFLIVSAARPEVEPIERMLVVRCSAERQAAAGELGLEFRHAGGDWLRAGVDATPGKPFAFTAAARPNSGSTLVMIWRRPPPGKLEFRTYLAATTALRGGTGGSLTVHTTLMSPDQVVSYQQEDVLEWPGQSGKTMECRIRSGDAGD